jgi:hypothetical protein
MPQVSVEDAIKILTLLVDVEPIAVELVQKLLSEIHGKTAAEIAAENDTIFERVKAHAREQLAANVVTENPNP